MGLEGLGEESDEINEYLSQHLGLEETDAERITLMRAANLPKQYQSQLEFFHDERLDEVTVAVVPDDLWHKGSQPSETDGKIDPGMGLIGIQFYPRAMRRLN